MKQDVFQMVIDIKTKSGSVLKPHEIHFWDMSNQKHPKHLHNFLPNSPFKFYTDAILGLCFHKMTDYQHLTVEQKNFSEKAYLSFNPYNELFQKSAAKIKNFRKKDLSQQIHFENFEKQMTAFWEQAFHKNTFSFEKIRPALDLIAEFESQISTPLIYNFSVHFSDKFSEKLICFYSFLFHLRSIVAVDHNAHIEDSSYESVTCDSISDYLPKADYTVNDALLYWHFTRLAQQFHPHKEKDQRTEKHFVEPLKHHFHQYSHNACRLVENLPVSFLGSLNQQEQEESLYQAQMDWLLGSHSGLLFKIREELFGVFEGYEKIFWVNTHGGKAKTSSSLNICFEISEKDLATNSSVA